MLLFSCSVASNSVPTQDYCSLPGSSVQEILQATILEWAVMPSSRDLPNPGIEPTYLMSPELAAGFLPGAGERHSTHDKGHEEGGLAYAKAGSSLRSPPGYSRASTPKTRVCLLYCFVLLPLTLPGAVPHHHLALPDKELTYSSN